MMPTYFDFPNTNANVMSPEAPLAVPQAYGQGLGQDAIIVAVQPCPKQSCSNAASTCQRLVCQTGLLLLRTTLRARDSSACTCRQNNIVVERH